VSGGVVARSLARRGQASRGEEIARNAVRIAAATDYLEMHADALMDLAEVVHLQGRAGEAVQHLQQALELYRRRGNAQSAARAVATIQALGGHRTA
jgi:tetratricopeptide (TPR) repeat protein